MNKRRGRVGDGIGRREALRRLGARAGASAAMPALRHAAAHESEDAARVYTATTAGKAPGAVLRPDPSLSKESWKPKFFDEHENETVVLLSDLIIPDTDTPGAKATQVNRLIDLLLSEAKPDMQKQYLGALGWLDGYCLSQYSNPFTRLGPSQQAEVLKLLTHNSDNPKIAYGANLFRLVKGSIVEAYDSSEIGTLQELKYETHSFPTELPGGKNRV